MFSNLGVSEIIVIFFILLPALLIIISLTDILKSNFEGNNKLIWVFIVVMLPVIGPILYFIIGRDQRISNE